MIFRRRTLPDALAVAVASAGADPDDRVLAWCPLVGGGATVLTLDHLVVVDVTGRARSTPWTHVSRAAWDPASRTVAVWTTGRRTPRALELERPGKVPQVLNERVQASIAAVRTVSVPGGQVRVVLRRDRAGHPEVQVPPVPGVDLAAPAVAAAVDAERRRLLDDIGA